MHGITKDDRGVVGFCKVFGPTWHGRPEYAHLDDAVPYDDAMKVIDLEVVKVPMAFRPLTEQTNLCELDGVCPQNEALEDGTSVPLMYSLVRTDTKKIVYPESVGAGYTIYPNKVFLEVLKESLLAEFPQIAIESAGTLFGGRVCFVNVILDKFQVSKDPSPQILRIMFYNAFGGRSITACMHIVRIVCNNTLLMAEAAGELNKTLKKFRHTNGAPGRVKEHIINISNLNELGKRRQEIFNGLADMHMTTEEVNNFLANLFPIPKDAGKHVVTGRTNKREKIEAAFNDRPDLQGLIARTRYSMLQAVTYITQHEMVPEDSKEMDDASAWFDVCTGGSRDKLNQLAFNLLTNPEIPAPKVEKSAVTA